ncbi:MBL fold metallo-hydrolase [Gabonibacter massiliensis]|uniref:MBL fold metallo-hydrolase n=1 Tax=Gabonibacter massiliensis TaxID=1720195 RepID=UPI00073EEB91|nr:MBL fold metallo-hydrolase [Gabonibacter massiliensis]
MEIKVFVNNPWQENTVVLYDETGEAVVIDCGCFSEEERLRVKDFLADHHLKPVALLDTHLHIDHIFGNDFMFNEYGLSAQAHPADAFWVEDAEKYAAMLGVRGITPPPALGDLLEDGQIVRFGHSELEVIHVPGHSPGGVCFYSKKDKLLISGDVLFEGSVGRADLPGGNMAELLDGIRAKLFVLPDDVRVIPGHGRETTIGAEKRYNPFFQV